MVGGALLAGCGTGPSQVGAAAIVGDTAIPIEYVQGWWDRFLSDPQLKEQVRAAGAFDNLGRAIVTEAVRHELLMRVARREGLQYDEAQVSEIIEQLGGEQAAVEAANSIYDRSTIRDRTRDQLVAVALARKFFDTTAITYDFMLVSSREQASERAAELARAGDGARDLLRDYGRKGAQVGFDEHRSIADSVDFVLRTPLFGVPAGNVVAYTDDDQANQGQWVVAVLRERSTDESPSTRPGTTTADRVNPSSLEAVGLRLLGLAAHEVGVRVNPRYGVWSDPYVAIGQTEGEIPTIIVPMARPASS